MVVRAVRVMLAAACAGVGSERAARAADTWTNASGSSSWDAPDNWADHTVPLLTDAVTFPAPGPLSRIVALPAAGNMVAQSLTFNSDYTLDGGRLDLTAGSPPAGAPIVVAEGVIATINSQIGTTANFTKSGPGALILDGPLLLNPNASIYIDAGTLRVRSDASLSGQWGRIYTRGTLVVDGTFSTNKRFEPSNGTIHVTAGNTLTLASNDQLGFSYADTWTKAGEGSLVAVGHTSRMGITHVDAGTLRLEGDVGYGPDVRGGKLELANQWGWGPQEVRIDAGSTGRVQSARGTTTLNNVKLHAASDVFPTLAGAADGDTLAIRNLTGGTSSSIITVAGAGVVEVLQPTTYAGAWNVTGGALRGNVQTLGPGSSPIVVRDSGTLLVGGAWLNRGIELRNGGTIRTSGLLAATAEDLIVERGAFDTNGFESRFARLRGTAGDAGNFTKTGMGRLRVSQARLQSLAVNQGRLQLADGGGVSRVGTLTVGTDAAVELRDNDLIIDANSETREQVLRALHDYISTARLISTAVNPLAGHAAVINPGLATFDGEAVDENSVIVKYTYRGDANIDGLIDADDYFRIDSGFLAQPDEPTYGEGDFNYNGQINADDYFLIDSSFLGQGQPLAGRAASAPAVSAVPEPAAILPAAGLLLLLRRRRG